MDIIEYKMSEIPGHIINTAKICIPKRLIQFVKKQKKQISHVEYLAHFNMIFAEVYKLKPIITESVKQLINGTVKTKLHEYIETNNIPYNKYFRHPMYNMKQLISKLSDEKIIAIHLEPLRHPFTRIIEDMCFTIINNKNTETNVVVEKNILEPMEIVI